MSNNYEPAFTGNTELCPGEPCTGQSFLLILNPARPRPPPAIANPPIAGVCISSFPHKLFQAKGYALHLAKGVFFLASLTPSKQMTPAIHTSS